MGVEPTSKAWEAFILPMNYARNLEYNSRFGAVCQMRGGTHSSGRCRFVKQMLHKREKEKEPHEEISSRGGGLGSCYTLCFVAQAAS